MWPGQDFYYFVKAFELLENQTFDVIYLQESLFEKYFYRNFYGNR